MEDNLIPLDKSWLIRMGVLDLVWGYQARTLKILEQQQELGDDLHALKQVIVDWDKGGPVSVGESGTLYRFLRFAFWRLGIRRELVCEGTLKNRPICNDPNIVTWSQMQLLTLDQGTSQWASAAVLMDDYERVVRLPNAPYKLQLTYEALDHWHTTHQKRIDWELRKDPTILRQMEAFEYFWEGDKPVFVPQQAEDFCFAYAFGLINEKEGESRWPQLSGHESNRLVEMPQEMLKARMGQKVESRDHRVVQAIAMWATANKTNVEFAHPGAVTKSWPRFWECLSYYRE